MLIASVVRRLKVGLVTVSVRQQITVLVLLLLFPFFFWGGVNSGGGRIEKAVWDMGHFWFFASMAYLLETILLQKIKDSTPRFIFIMIAVACCAAGVEIVQLFLPGRYASLSDFSMGIAGGFTVLSLLGSSRACSYRRFALLGIAAGAFVLSVSPFLLAVYDEYSARRTFPLLSDFESFQEISRWGDCHEIKRVSEPVKTGHYAMRVALQPGKYPGVTLRYFPENWSRAKELQFSVYNPGPGVVLHYRINDALHEFGEERYDDRFHGTQLLDYGWNSINIDMRTVEDAPSKRPMNLNRIRKFRIFLVDNDRERYLYIDDVRLIVEE